MAADEPEMIDPDTKAALENLENDQDWQSWGKDLIQKNCIRIREMPKQWKLTQSFIRNVQEIVELQIPPEMRVANRVALDIALDYIAVSPAPNALNLLKKLGPLNIKALCQDGLLVPTGNPVLVPETHRKYKGSGSSEWVFISG